MRGNILYRLINSGVLRSAQFYLFMWLFWLTPSTLKISKSSPPLVTGNSIFQPDCMPRGGGGGGTLILSYIRRLGSFLGVQNFEFQYFLSFSEKIQKKIFGVCLFVCFVALRPKSTAMVIAGRPVHLTTLFLGRLEQAVNQ